MADEVKQLLKVLDSLGESSQFCTGGSLTPVLPGLEIEGIGSLGVPLTAADAKRRTAKPIESPADWSRDAEIDCACGDCRDLVRFLRDPVERVHRFPRRKELRQHLHGKIDAQGLDLTHVTERRGSPQTLVCTKTQASYERRLAQYRVDTRLLAELERLVGGVARPAAPAARHRSGVKAARKG